MFGMTGNQTREILVLLIQASLVYGLARVLFVHFAVKLLDFLGSTRFFGKKYGFEQDSRGLERFGESAANRPKTPGTTAKHTEAGESGQKRGE